MSGNHGIPQGSIILTPKKAQMLYQAAHLGELRSRHRVGFDALHQLLTEITVCAFTQDADPGIEPRQETASEEREWWTTEQLARTSRRATRTIRNDIGIGSLPATKNPNGWLIRADHAKTYIEEHRKIS